MSGVQIYLRPDWVRGQEAGDRGANTLTWTHIALVAVGVDLRDFYGGEASGATQDDVYIPDQNGTRFKVTFIERIGVGTARAGMEQPVYYWDPVIAPSGALFYTGERFPQWRGDLFVGSLQPGRLVRLRLRDGRVAHEERYVIGRGERIRDVVQGPDGFLYLLTDHPRGRIIRVQP